MVNSYWLSVIWKAAAFAEATASQGKRRLRQKSDVRSETEPRVAASMHHKRLMMHDRACAQT